MILSVGRVSGYQTLMRHRAPRQTNRGHGNDETRSQFDDTLLEGDTSCELVLHRQTKRKEGAQGRTGRENRKPRHTAIRAREAKPFEESSDGVEQRQILMKARQDP